MCSERVVLEWASEMNNDSKTQKALGALGSRGPPCALRCAPVLGGPGFPDPASPFQSTVRASSDEPSFASLTRTPGTAPQTCHSPGRGMNAAPGQAVAAGRVIRRGRTESGEEWWLQSRARFIARAARGLVD